MVAGAVVVGALTWIPTGAVNWARWAVVSVVVYCAGCTSCRASSRAAATRVDRLATALVTSAFGVVLLPLISVVWTVVQRGWARMDAEFFTSTMRGVVGEGGGAWHAIVGTLIITGITTLFSVPFGLFIAIYLVEYGQRSTGQVDHRDGRRDDRDPLDRLPASSPMPCSSCGRVLVRGPACPAPSPSPC